MRYIGKTKIEVMKNTILIAYFLQKGKTEETQSQKVVAQLGEALKAKGEEYSTFAITPTETYPEERENFEIVTKLEKENRKRPELTSKYSGMKDVTHLLLVAPNWWNDLPMAVYSFLDEYDFADKKIVPVILHGGDGADKITEALRGFLHKNWILPTVAISNAADDQAEIAKAIEELFQPSVSRY